MTSRKKPHPSSFRDPSGQVYYKGNTLYRSVAKSYAEDYDHLIKSGLYKKLTALSLLNPHKEVKKHSKAFHKTLKPEIVPFISYPYEWTFGQLKDAALATLNIQILALSHGMALKDASAYNIQFIDNNPVLIDTLSFETYRQGEPWVAYRQFCMHFLTPLLLMKYKSPHLNILLRTFLDGIPLSIASSLLPKKTLLNRKILTHIHAQAFFENKYSGKKIAKKPNLSKSALEKIILDLKHTVEDIKEDKDESFWQGYYEDNNYTKKAFQEKIDTVTKMIKKTKAKKAWDLGANTGLFSHISAKEGIHTVSTDNDPKVVEGNYLYCKKKGIKNCLPIVIDITNPSPSIGWGNEERDSLVKRGPVDLVMALALVHHLSISANIPIDYQSGFLSKITNYLIIEFVPKEDSQVQRLLTNREDIFANYNQDYFEKQFRKKFKILEKKPVKNSKRTLYLMKNKKPPKS